MKNAADNGDFLAMMEVAKFYEAGIGRVRNRVRAFEYYKKAAERNHTEGTYKTAIAYATGSGTQVNPIEFKRLIQSAVRIGHQKAYMATGLADLQEAGLINDKDTSRVLHCFETLREAVQQIKSSQKLSERSASEGVAHFTKLEAIHSMLPIEISHRNENFLRLYNITYVNDPQEGRSLISVEHETAQMILKLFPSSEQKNENNLILSSHSHPLRDLAFSVYVGSFTLKPDRLDLWRAYGNDGNGFSLVTPFETFEETQDLQEHGFAGLAAAEESMLQTPMTLYRVIYNDKKVTKVLDQLKPLLENIFSIRDKLAKRSTNGEEIKKKINRTTREILSDIYYLYKNSEYESEDEVRMLAPYAISAQSVSADDQVPAKLYVKTKEFLFSPGSKIIIGPKVRNPETVRLELIHRLDRNGHTNVAVEFSSIPYR